MKDEIWKDIEGYEGYYQVSNTGKIKSVERMVDHPRYPSGVRLKERYLVVSRYNKKYAQVVLCKNGGTKTFRVCRLVAAAFVPNPDNLPQVNHIDENPSNDMAENLEWCDCAYNITYSKGMPCKFTREGEIVEANSIREMSRLIDSNYSQVHGVYTGRLTSTRGWKKYDAK